MLDGVKVKIRVGGDFEPIPMDRYTCQIADVSLVRQFNQFKGEEVEMLNYKFAILDEKPMPEKADGSKAGTTRGRFLWKRCSLSMSERSWLMKLAKAAEGRDLSKAEMEAFDPESIVEKQVDVMVEQNPSKDGTTIYNNIVAFSKTLKQLPTVEVKASTGAVEKQTVSAVAPEDGEEDPETVVAELENGGKDEVAELEEAAKIAAEKVKAAKSKAGK